MQTLKIGEKEDKPLVKILVVIFGLLCLITAGWWTVFLIRFPDNENVFWLASIFLFFFGLYQVYSGLGYARRYISKDASLLIIRQNSLLPPKKIEAGSIRQLEVRSMDLLFHLSGSGRYRVKLGLRYPDLGMKIKTFIIEFAGENNIEVFYKNEPL